MFGLAVGYILLYLGAVLAVLQACVRRTRGWIVIGGLGGTLLLTLVVLLGIPVVTGFRRGLAHQRAMKSRAVVDLSQVSQTVEGRASGYKIVLPPGWTPAHGSPGYDVTSQRGALHVAVVVGPSVGTPIEIANEERDRVRKAMPDATFGDMASVQIDGRFWLQFPAQGHRSTNGQENQCQLYVYSGPEGMFRIVGWREGPASELDESVVRDIATSFRFPSSAHPRTHAAVKFPAFQVDSAPSPSPAKSP